MSYVIGVDSSTTATKAVVWNREGRAVADGRAEFSLALPRPGRHEQDAEDWWRSTVTAVRRALQSVDASAIEAIGLTHQRETFACLGEDGRALRPAIVWMDVRATREVEQLGSDDVHRLTGKPADTTPALYRVVRTALGYGHETFGRMWREGGRARADRTRRWIATHGRQMRAALGVH
jgi:xylulokinase